MKKQIIREQMLVLRKQLDDRSYVKLSRKAQDRLIAVVDFQRATTLALYSPIRHEVATDQLFSSALVAGKRIFYPRIRGENLEFCQVFSVDELVVGAFGVAEPVDEVTIAVADLDLIVVPGVAFSFDGFRLGYGRGFYDRQLVGRPATTITIGLCFDFQLINQLPAEEHDQKLDYIVTETKFIPCRT